VADAHGKIARDAQKLLKANAELTVDEVAEQLEAEPEDVRIVLDEFDASQTPPVHVGPGGGHGWVKQ
jgi:hypothetical protein